MGSNLNGSLWTQIMESNRYLKQLGQFYSYLLLFAPVHAQDAQIRSTAHKVLTAALCELAVAGQQRPRLRIRVGWPGNGLLGVLHAAAARLTYHSDWRRRRRRQAGLTGGLLFWPERGGPGRPGRQWAGLCGITGHGCSTVALAH
jgi:hypothetical protein